MATDKSIRFHVGSGLDQELLRAHLDRFQRREENEHFKQLRTDGKDVRHLFVTVPDEENYTRAVVDSWLGDSTNTTRVAPGHKLNLKAFATVRMSDLARPVHLPKGIREQAGVVVLIPLETWDEEHGSILGKIRMTVGEYLAIDGRQPVTFPASKGGVSFVWFYAELSES